jgi:AcrR family transcriptional regulator
MEQGRARRVDAEMNRQRLLDAARAAFSVTGAETSMAEVARRSGLGSATLYRNFATRQDLIEALLVDEVCAAAATAQGDSAGERLIAWLDRFFDYVTTKRPMVLGLLVLEDTDITNPVFQTREKLLIAGRPLLADAQVAGEVVGEIGLDHVLDLIVAIAKIFGPDKHRRRILDVALRGLLAQPPETRRSVSSTRSA